jgi:hypothetical protein
MSRLRPGRSARPAPSARLGILVAIALLAAGCGSAAAPTPGFDCGHWCGNASATVTYAGQTSTISGGGCYDGGSAGIDVRIGDWQGEGTGDFLMLEGYRPGGPTPNPTVGATDDAGNPIPSATVTGNVAGTPFTLDTNGAVVFTSATAGTFSGDDVNGNGAVSGTFNCG